MKTSQGVSPYKKIKFGLYSLRSKTFLTQREYNKKGFRIVENTFFNRLFRGESIVIFKPLKELNVKK